MSVGAAAGTSRQQQTVVGFRAPLRLSKTEEPPLLVVIISPVKRAIDSLDKKKKKMVSENNVKLVGQTFPPAAATFSKTLSQFLFCAVLEYFLTKYCRSDTENVPATKQPSGAASLLEETQGVCKGNTS